MRARIRFVVSVVASTAVVMFANASTRALQNATAKGGGTFQGASCQLVSPTTQLCSAGGSGANISFSFQGEVVDPNAPAVAVLGNFTAYYPDTGLKVEFVSGTAQIFPSQHLLTFQGTCQTTNSQGVIIGFGTGTCSGSAQDNTSNGADDTAAIFVSTSGGFIQAFGQAANGNININ